jgi:hypothetical protein
MADINKQSNSAAAEGYLQELKQRAEEAHKRGDIFMMNIYVESLKLVSPIVNRAISRGLREERARINQLHSELRSKAAADREKAREQKSKQSGPNATTRLGD